MTREETKELIAENRIAVMQAYVDGKQIQFFNEYTGEWETFIPRIGFVILLTASSPNPSTARLRMQTSAGRRC